jgi:hypothetical protein
VRVDPSSDPGRDEYGLPPVDIEIPDDARDLDRDVQAYHREVRVQRRRARLNRVTGPLVRRGMVIPLVAVCLALTLLSGTLLSVVAGRQNASPSATASGSARRPTAPSAAAASQLPNAPVTLDGKQVSLRKLVPAVLAWVPDPCSCVAALKQLARQAARAHVPMYLVGEARAAMTLSSLAQQVGQRSSQVVNDTANVIDMTYRPVGLTAILARSDGTVRAVIREFQATNSKLASALPTLISPSPAAGRSTPSASANGSASASRPTPQAT